MPFGPTPMRRVYIAIPAEYEDDVLSKIGELGILQLIREFQAKRPEKSKIMDLSGRFDRLNEKLDAILGKPPTELGTRTIIDLEEAELTCQSAEDFLVKAEVDLNGLITSLNQLETELKANLTLEDKLKFLVDNNLGTDEIGIFEHVFVKVGFMKPSLTGKFATYLAGTSVISVTLSGRPRENFLIIAGLNDDRSFSEDTLRLLNFEEMTFPSDLNPDSKVAFDEANHRIAATESRIAHAKDDMARIQSRAVSFSFCLTESVRYQEAKELVMRTKSRSLIHGWVPQEKVNYLRSQIESVVPKEGLYFNVEEPRLDDSVPVQFRSKGIIRAFELFTLVQGVPNYFEINPTPIYVLLYVLMFGMMFGDIGGGIVLMLIGVVLTRLRKGFFSFSLGATKRIAQIMISCGFAAMAFGFVYGTVFLLKTPFPGLLSPLTNIGEIIVIALAFGVAQIMLSMILNVINMLRRKEPLKVIFGERGIIGIAFYSAGIVVAYNFIIEKSFGVFLEADVVAFSAICVTCLVLILLSPLIESTLTHEEGPRGKKLLEGFGIGLEAFIAFIANSVSYIRLAAFAIAHEAIAIAAVVLGAVLGSILSLVLLNVLDFGVEGFASFIQSLRLMYYEFSTRFFLKNGLRYEPFKVGQLRIKV